MNPLLIRGLSLFLPALALWLVWRRVRPGHREAAAALVATVWQFPALLALHEWNRAEGWWHFEAEGGLLHGMPVDLWVGWALLWGALPALALRRLPVWAAALLLAALDAVLMPLCAPVVQLHDSWWLGEAAAVGTALVPGLLFARWTAEGRGLGARTVMQFLTFSTLMLWVIPSIVLQETGQSWRTALERPWPWQCVLLSLTVFMAVPALSAVQEFHRRGQGTPLPLDPPRRLVMTGPYAYVANPMQAAMVPVFVLWGVWTGSVWVGLIAFAAVTTTAGIAGWNEAEDMESRFGETWLEYRRAVPRWWPRRHPHITLPARLYVAQSCGKCRSLGAWLTRRGLRGLEILPAEEHPRALTRLTYEGAGFHETGIRALGRALEHIHFGWAWAGWLLRLPMAAPVVQWIMDHCGAGPQRLPRSTKAASETQN